MKSNQIRVRVSSRRGVMPFGSVDTKLDKKHLNKLLVFVLELMAADEHNAKARASSEKEERSWTVRNLRSNTPQTMLTFASERLKNIALNKDKENQKDE